MSTTPIRVRLLAFGALKTIVSAGIESRELPVGASVGDLLALLGGEGRGDDAVLRTAAVAVNQQYSPRSCILRDGDEVAILPPVSGGLGLHSGTPLVALVREPIDGASIERDLKSGADGALCVFDGIVRNNSRGRETLHLDYEAYEAMALQQMQLLRTEAIEYFGVRDIAIVHRLGRLVVGETSVFIAVASAHRGAAFDACRWVIDTLKKTVPIWKKEQFVDGAAWADGEPFPDSVVGDAG
jgi:molybdopterin synthase catalytic subunit